MGFYRADQGDLLLDARDVAIRNPRNAQARSIGMVYQHFTLVPSLTVLGNLTMGKGCRVGRIDWRAERAALTTFLETMPFGSPIDRPVSTLAAGEKQKAEILKQLWFGTRFLILDELTSVLTPNEADEMVSLLRGMVAGGRLTVLIITHKFREVQAFADEVSVLRRGRFAGGGTTAALRVDAMARLMVGDAPPREATLREGSARGEPLLALDAVYARDDAGMPALRDVSLAVRVARLSAWRACPAMGRRRSSRCCPASGATAARCRCRARPTMPPAPRCCAASAPCRRGNRWATPASAA